MILSDATIRERVTFVSSLEPGHITIHPFESAHVQPASYDLTLGGNKPLWLWPFCFTLASTREWVGLPADVQGQVHGRSSIGRLGILVHFTAGYVDPGFRGNLTLECINLTLHPRVFWPGERICQIAFTQLDRPAERPYTGRYAHSHGTVPSKFYQDRKRAA